MTKRRILMIGPVDFSIDNAPKVHFSNLAKEFSNLGFEVLCLVYAPKNDSMDKMSGELKVSFAPNPLIGNIFLRTIKYLFLLPFILWHFLIFAPNILYFRFSPPAFLYLSVLRLFKFRPLNFKIVLEFNDWVPEQRKIQGENEFKVKIIEFLQLKSLLLVDYVRVVTQGIKNKFNPLKTHLDKIHVIGNGTDINYFKPIDKTEAKKRLGLDPDCLYVGFIGNFSIWQGLDQLLSAIPIVLKNLKGVRFILVGDGPEMAKVKKSIANFKENEVILTGTIPYELANNYINAFDIGVAPKQPNITIGYSPLKIRDYSACGVPIVTTRIKGMEIVEKERFGILVPPASSAALAEAILKLLKDSKLRTTMGKRGRTVAEELFSWKFIVQKILKMVKIRNEKT